MEHVLKTESFFNQKITVVESDNSIEIIIFNNNNEEKIKLNKKELHSFIGTLLHVQSKISK